VAQKIQTLFIDDIDGSEAEGTVRFALDGAEYEIDLNAKHADALRKSLARYIDAARRSTGRPVGRPGADAGRRLPGSTPRKFGSGRRRKASTSRTAGACPPNWWSGSARRPVTSLGRGSAGG